jgi:hypothetical protein
MSKAILAQAFVRHLLTGVAGAMAVKYGVDGETLDLIIGGFTAFVGVAWSIYDKKK